MFFFCNLRRPLQYIILFLNRLAHFQTYYYYRHVALTARPNTFHEIGALKSPIDVFEHH